MHAEISFNIASFALNTDTLKNTNKNKDKKYR